MSIEPIIDILQEDSKKNDSVPDTNDDIQVINRTPFDVHFDQTSAAGNGANYGGSSGSNAGPISGAGNGIGPGSGTSGGAGMAYDDAYGKNMEFGGLTPILQSLDDPIDEIDNNNQEGMGFENQLVMAQPKLYSNLPPMAPLSESVIPNGLNFQPFSYDSSDNQGLLLNRSSANNQTVPSTSTGSKKRKDTTPKTRPAFVMKIWSMVNDPANNEYIKWDNDGKSFQVFHREEFMKNILPKYFKHNNFASFVRQLNMYGWHKVQDISNGTLKDDKTGEENWKFENPYFQKGREDLLDNIVRNKSMAQDSDVSDKQINLKLILGELDNIRLNQMALQEDLRRIRKDNKTLWQENFITRERHLKQSQTLDKILKFLATVYGNNNTGKILEVEDNTPSINLDNINDDGFFEKLSSSSVNNTRTNSSANGSSFSNGNSGNSKPMLMLMNQAYKSSANTTPGNAGETSSHNSPTVHDNDVINGLEQNIFQQGQSIQQVQDWIQKLSNQQQLQQQQLLSQQQQIDDNSRHHQENELNGGVPLTPGKLDLDFDVNDFLRSGANTPAGNTPAPEDYEPKRKRAKSRKFEEL